LNCRGPATVNLLSTTCDCAHGMTLHKFIHDSTMVSLPEEHGGNGTRVVVLLQEWGYSSQGDTAETRFVSVCSIPAAMGTIQHESTVSTLDVRITENIRLNTGAVTISWWASVLHNQRSGHTKLQTVNLRQPCFQCRWSSLLERSTRQSKSQDISFDCFRQQLKTFLFCRY